MQVLIAIWQALNAVWQALIGRLSSSEFWKIALPIAAAILVLRALTGSLLSSAAFLKIAIPAAGAILAWYFNERSKLASEQYKRKEESYKELLRCLRGFYLWTTDNEDSTTDKKEPTLGKKKLKEQFLYQVNLLWLYAPDNVIQAAYAFLATVKTNCPPQDRENKEVLCGAFVVAVRKDLLGRRVVKNTALTAADFQILVAT